MFSRDDTQRAASILAACTTHKTKLVTAESCTGGLFSSLFTSIPGASENFLYGIVGYTNAAKVRFLNVPQALLTTYGAVSEPVALSMAKGALPFDTHAVSVAITGIAGPSGGTPAKPIGTVYIACTDSNGYQVCHHYAFTGDRTSIRLHTVREVLTLLEAYFKSRPASKSE